MYNAIDKERGVIAVEITEGNVGGSHVVEAAALNNKTVNVESVKSLLLADVFQDVAKFTGTNVIKPITVLLKLDIERYECRAVAGSRKLFRDQRCNVPSSTFSPKDVRLFLTGS